MRKLTSTIVKVSLTLLLTLTIAFQAKAQYACHYLFEVCLLECDLTKLDADNYSLVYYNGCNSGCTQISDFVAQADCYAYCGSELDDQLLGNEAEWHSCGWDCTEDYCSCEGIEDC